MSKECSLDNPKYVEELITFLHKGGTVQQIYGISDADLTAMFAAAGRYLTQKRYKEAADCFVFLTFLNPYHADFWMGLGQCYRLSKDYEKAIETYTMASVYDYDDPRPHFHCADCYLALEEGQKALDRIVLTLDRCRGKKEFASLQEVCYELVDDINSRLKKGDD